MLPVGTSFASSVESFGNRKTRPLGRVVQKDLLLIATLVASLAKKLAVLLLRHALAALLND